MYEGDLYSTCPAPPARWHEDDLLIHLGLFPEGGKPGPGVTFSVSPKDLDDEAVFYQLYFKPALAALKNRLAAAEQAEGSEAAD